MKSLKYILIIIIAILTGCKKDKPFDNTLQQIKSDSIFINTITDKDYTIAIHRIDSLLDTKSFSNHKTALLYYEKGQKNYAEMKVIKALGNYTLALQFFKNDVNNIYTVETHLSLGDIYRFLDSIEKAKSHLSKANKIIESYGTKKTLARMYAINASLKSKTRKYEEAIQLFIKAINIDITSEEVPTLYLNMSTAYLRMNDSENFEKYCLNAIQLAPESDPIKAYSQCLMGKYYLKKNNLKNSKKYYLDALRSELKRSSSNNKLLLDIYKVLTNISTKNKDFENVINYSKSIDSINKIQLRLKEVETLKAFDSKNEIFLKEQEVIMLKNKKIRNNILFISFIFITLLLSILLFLKNKNAKLKISRDKIQLEQSLLRSQMNPHFIFNTLTAIQNSLMDNDPLKSVTYISKFSKLIRQNFDFISKKTIYLNEEIDALKNYLDTQKFRFKDVFDYVFDIAENINTFEIMIPPLLIQPFVENAIEHGFKYHKKQGLITIRITKQDKHINFEINDNGTGFETSKKNDGKLHAIDIFKKRLKLLQNKDEKSFEIVSSEKGTIIKFSLKQ